MSGRLIRDLPVDQIVVGPQARTEIDEEALTSLAQNLREAGLMQPIGVVALDGGRHEHLWGSRRLAAAKRAGWESIEAIVEERPLSSAESLERQLCENVLRRDLGPVEKARAISRLMQETGCTAAEIAERIGLSGGQLSKLRPLLLLEKPLQEAVNDGSVAASTAYEIARVADPALRARLAAEATDGKLTREEVSRRSKQARTAQRARKPRRMVVRKAVVIELGQGRAIRFSGPELTVAALVGSAEELLERIQDLPSMDLDLAEAVSLLSAERA